MVYLFCDWYIQESVGSVLLRIGCLIRFFTAFSWITIEAVPSLFPRFFYCFDLPFLKKPEFILTATKCFFFNLPTSLWSSANPTKWSNTLKQFVGNLPTNCLSVFYHFVKLAVKGLTDFPVTSKSTPWEWCKKLGFCYKGRNKKWNCINYLLLILCL